MRSILLFLGLCLMCAIPCAVAAVNPATIPVCHRIRETLFVPLQVAPRALASHLAHGDRPYAFGCVFQLDKNEERLDLLTWEGYAEQGKILPDVDWVTPFEQATGCKVHTHYVGNSDELKALTQAGGFDLASIGGEIGLDLIRTGAVQPINPALLPHYGEVFEALRQLPHVKVGDDIYGVPIGRGQNALTWDPEAVDPPVNSWALVYAPDSSLSARSTVYDSPMTIAEAALYLRSARPELGITDPYELDPEQFDAVLDLLRERQAGGGLYWSFYTEEIDQFSQGKAVVASGWQITADLAGWNGVFLETGKPQEGMTAFDDVWMMPAWVKHPNCAYRWMDYFITAAVNAQASEFFGQAPANVNACDFMGDPDFCTRYHATDLDYWSDVEYWKAPQRDCGDERGLVCMDTEDWAQAWETLRTNL